MIKADVLVLGAGIIGVCCALQLQKRGQSVLLLDRRGVGEETSFGNAGLIERSSVFPYMFPRDFKSILKYALNRSPEAHYHPSYLLKVAPWLYRYWRRSSEAGIQSTLLANLPLIENCLTEHEMLAGEASVLPLLRKVGWMRVSRSEADFVGAKAQAEKTLPYGVRFDVLDAKGVEALEPHLSDDVIGAIHYVEPASVSDPHALTLGYYKLFEALGGCFALGDANSLAQNGSGWRVMSDEGQQIEAKFCVVALGPWSNALAKAFGYSIPMEIKRGYHMHYAAHGNALLNRPVMEEGQGYMLAPMAGGIRLTTGAEFAPINAPKTPVQLAQTEILARRIFPLQKRLEAEPWLGQRPCLPDMVPIIAKAPRQNGLFFAYGHHHHGLTNAAVTGRLIADLVTGEASFIDPQPYRMDRF